MTRSLEKDLHNEMLLEQRNLLMRIRMEDNSMRKYQIAGTGFGEYDVVERKMKTKEMKKIDERARNKELGSYSRS